MTIEPLSAPYIHPCCRQYDLCRIRNEGSGCECARIDARSAGWDRERNAWKAAVVAAEKTESQQEARMSALQANLEAAEKVMGEANDLIASATPTQMLPGGFIIEGEKHAALADALEVYAALGKGPA